MEEEENNGEGIWGEYKKKKEDTENILLGRTEEMKWMWATTAKKTT